MGNAPIWTGNPSELLLIDAITPPPHGVRWKWLRSVLTQKPEAVAVIMGPAGAQRRWPSDVEQLYRLTTDARYPGEHHVQIAYQLGCWAEQDKLPIETILISRHPGLRELMEQLGHHAYAEDTEALSRALIGHTDVTHEGLLQVYRRLRQHKTTVKLERFAEAAMSDYPELRDRHRRHALFGSSRFSRITRSLGLAIHGDKIVGVME